MRSLLCFSLSAAVMLGLAVVLAPRLTDRDSAASVVAAAVICTIAGVVAMTPPCLAAARQPAWMTQAALGWLVLRLLLTVGSGFAYASWARPVADRTFWMALVASHLILLAVEAGVIMLLARKCWPASKAS